MCFITCFEGLMYFILLFVFIIHFGNSIKYEPLHENNTNSVLGGFATNIVEVYFKHYRCVFVVTDKEACRTFLSNFTLPVNISVITVKTDQKNCSSEYFNNVLEHGFSQSCAGYIVQLERPLCFLDTLQKVTSSSLYRQQPRLLFLPTQNKPIISSTLFSTKQLEFTPDVLVVDLKILHFKNNLMQFKLSTVDWLLGSTVLAECVPQQCAYININLFPDKLQNLKGKEIRVSALHYAPYVVLEPTLDGSEIRMANEFARLHNCSWKITGVPAVEEWGELYENGTGTGVLGAVVENKADMGLGGLFVNLETFNFLSFTSIYSQGRMTCLVPKPEELLSVFLPLKPFAIYTWQSIILTILITSAVLYVYNKLVKTIYSYGRGQRHAYRMDMFVTYMLLTFGMLLNQPFNRHLHKWFLIIFLQFIFMTITTTYSSILAAIVTIPSYSKPIETAEDLANSGLLWGATHNYWAIDFMNSTIPYQKILRNNFRVLTKEELKKKSFTGDFAFVLERLATDYYAVHDFITEEAAEKLVLMKDQLYNDVTVIVLRKGSPYTESFNTLIGRVVSSGIFKYWEGHVSRKIFHPKIQQIVSHSLAMPPHKPTVITVRNIAGAIFLLLFGLCVATIMFIMEFQYNDDS